MLYFNKETTDFLLNYFRDNNFPKSLYNIIGIEWSRIQDMTGFLQFSMKDVVEMVDKIEFYSQVKYTEMELIKETGNMDVSQLLYNLYYNVFDKWIFLYLSDDYIYHRHKRKVFNPLSRMKYIIQKLKGNRFVYANGKKSSYTVENIIELKKQIGNFKDYPSNFSLKTIISANARGTYNRVIWNTEEGVYDKWIELYLNKKSTAPIDSVYIKEYIDRRLDDIEPYNIVECTNNLMGIQALRSRKQYEYYFRYEDRRGGLQLSVFSKSDVLRLKNAYDKRELLHLGEYCNLVPHLGEETVKRVLVSIIRGRFDKFI